MEKDISLPKVKIEQLFEVKAHFGHRKWYLNSKMSSYIHSERNGLSIIDLTKTIPLLNRALEKLREVGAKHGKILFVGTRNHVADMVKESAERCVQFYVNHRWLGGLITNWFTINKSITKLRELEKDFEEKIKGYTKKEISIMESKKQKMKSVFDGIKNMNGLPELIVVLDVMGSGRIAIQEANNKGIPVIALVDTNCDPTGIDYPIPANDDSAKCVSFILDLFVKSILAGVKDNIEVKDLNSEKSKSKEVVEDSVDDSDLEDNYVTSNDGNVDQDVEVSSNSESA